MKRKYVVWQSNAPRDFLTKAARKRRKRQQQVEAAISAATLVAVATIIAVLIYFWGVLVSLWDYQ